MIGRRIHSTAGSSVRGTLRISLLVLTVVAVTAFTQIQESTLVGEVTLSGTDAMPVSETLQDSVEVTLEPYEIDMPATLPAGTTIFSIANVGTSDLGFAIEGEGVEEQVSPIPPGETQSLTVDLQPGTYTVYCPVSDLRERGMETTLTVEEGGVE